MRMYSPGWGTTASEHSLIVGADAPIPADTEDTASYTVSPTSGDETDLSDGQTNVMLLDRTVTVNSGHKYDPIEAKTDIYVDVDLDDGFAFIGGSVRMLLEVPGDSSYVVGSTATISERVVEEAALSQGGFTFDLTGETIAGQTGGADEVHVKVVLNLYGELNSGDTLDWTIDENGGDIPVTQHRPRTVINSDGVFTRLTDNHVVTLGQGGGGSVINSGSGGVSTVFGRSGDVTAQGDDYASVGTFSLDNTLKIGGFSLNDDGDLVLTDSNGVELIRQPEGGATQFIQGAEIGTIDSPEDSLTQIINAASTSAAAAGHPVGYTFAVDNQSFLEISAEAGGSGGIQNGTIKASRDINLGGNSIENLHRIGDSGNGKYIDFTENNNYIEVQDENGNREKLAASEVEADSHSTDNFEVKENAEANSLDFVYTG
jgi:hypothetical protein